MVSFYSNLQTCYHLNKISLKWTNIQEASGLSTSPNATRTISSKAWNSPEYPSRECKHGIEESLDNMFNPIFNEYIQRRKHPGSGTFAEPELLSYRKPKVLFKKYIDGNISLYMQNEIFLDDKTKLK